MHLPTGFVAGLDLDLVSLREHRAPALMLSSRLAGALPYASDGFDLGAARGCWSNLLDPPPLTADAVGA